MRRRRPTFRGWPAVTTLGLAVFVLAGCPQRTASNTDADPADEGRDAAAPARAAWGEGPPVDDPFVPAQLARDPGDPALAAALDAQPMPAAAPWARLRIDGRHTVELGLAVARRGDAEHLGALALLEPPPVEPGGPGEPIDAWGELEDTLWTRYAVTDDVDEAQALLLAIARTGGAASITRLAVDLAHLPERAVDGDPGAASRRYDAGLRALGILCSRGHALDEIARDAVGQGLEAQDAGLRASAAWTLWRCVEPSAEVLSLAAERKILIDRLARLLTRSDEEAAAAWKGLAAFGELPQPLPTEPLRLGADGRGRHAWWVEVAAVQALAKTADGRQVLRDRLQAVADDGFETWSGPRAHVLLEMVRSVRPHLAGDDELSMAIEKLLERVRTAAGGSKRRERMLLLLRCEAEAARATVTGELAPVEACGADEVLGPHMVASLAVDALLDMGDVMPRDDRIAALITRASDRTPERAAPALAALAEVDDGQAKEVLRRALGRADPGVLAAAAGAIAARSVDASRRDPQVVPSLTGLAEREEPELIEARLAAIEALGALGRGAATGVAPKTGQTDAPSPPAIEAPWLASTVLPLAASPDASVRARARDALLGHDDLLARFDAQARVAATAGVGERFVQAGRGLDHGRGGAVRLRVVTEAGEFVVRLGGAQAPIGQGNVARLASEKFYDGLRFHRVVPGFVVQGGDPRGDGYGGPGYLVPCEYANTRFERGVVGIATAGKDTGGSQLFITHTPQPHLDGRYTVIGAVESGMDVVDALLPYDQILRVEVERG